MSSLETYKGEGKNSALLTCITVCALVHISQFCTIKISTRENAHKPQEGVGSHGVELQMAMSHLTQCQVLHKSSKHS